MSIAPTPAGSFDMKAIFFPGVNTNPCESGFGCQKYVGSSFMNISPTLASAVACATKNHLFEFQAHLYERKKAGQSEALALDQAKGPFDELSVEQQQIFVQDAASAAKKEFQSDMNKLKLRAKEALVQKLEQAKAEAKEKQIKLYLLYQKCLEPSPVVSDADVMRLGNDALTMMLDKRVEEISSDSARSKTLSELLKRYVAQGHGKLRPKAYTSIDPSIGAAGTPVNVSFLRNAVVEAWATIKKEKLHLDGEPAIPDQFCRKLVQFGPMTQQRKDLEAKELCSKEELVVVAAALREAAKKGAKEKAPHAPRASGGARDHTRAHQLAHRRVF